MKKRDALEDALDRALAPYAKILPPETLACIREEMREYAMTHPYPVALLRQLNDVREENESHVRRKDGAADAAPLERVNGTRRAK